ncbi:hypothetical protein FS749_007495 [Ceratobasidium sp. UAMH 11750]|nr:hypothetical protein FS749_007495 [Ceratobasidium sp. UAMH 11750]
MAPKLRDILCALPNLRELSLSATFVTINMCFNNLKPPFSLERLACPCVGSGALWSFLRTQKSITTLEFLGECNPDKFVHAVPQDILPRLTTIAGTVDALTTFSRLRPVSNITITGFGAHFTTRDLVLSLDQAPVESITCFEYDPDITAWGCLLQHTSIGKFAKSLKRWTVIHNCTLQYLTKESLPENYLDRFSELHALEEFSIVRNALGDESTPVPTEWLRDLAKPGVWRRIVPSLRAVSIFGEELL